MKQQEFLDPFIATAVGESILGQAPRSLSVVGQICERVKNSYSPLYTSYDFLVWWILQDFRVNVR